MTYFYGLDAELQKKQESKFDPKRAQEAKQWIQTILKEPLPNGDFVASLQNGIILATYISIYIFEIYFIDS